VPRLLAAIVAIALGSCSTLPVPSHPAHVDHRFHASFKVDRDGRLHLPVTTRDIVVQSLELLPKPAGELFAAEQRWFVYPAGTSVQVRGQLRLYASPSGVIPKLAEVLPNATLHTDETAH